MTRARWSGAIGLAADIGLPTVAYFTARAAGMPELTALLVGASLAIIRVIWVAARTRSVTWFAVLTLAGYGIGAALTLVTGDPRLLLLKESATTAVAGTVVAATAAFAAPMTLRMAQILRPDSGRDLQRRFDTDQRIRRHYRRGTSAWGIGLVVDAIARLPLVLLLPLDTAVLTSQLLLFTILGVLTVWTWLRHTAARRHDPHADSHHTQRTS